MITQRVYIREDSQAVYLDTYLLHNSREYQTDARLCLTTRSGPQ
jgi:hypothetical protein